MRSLILCFLFAAATATAVAGSQKPSKLTGWISDSSCGMQHVKTPDVACVKKCIRNGARPVFVDDAKKQVWAIDNPDAISNLYGRHVAVDAIMDTVKSVHISVHITNAALIKQTMH